MMVQTDITPIDIDIFQRILLSQSRQITDINRKGTAQEKGWERGKKYIIEHGQTCRAIEYKLQNIESKNGDKKKE